MGSHSKRKSSIVWNFFTIRDGIKATCKICRKSLSYKSSITNLKKHINRKHPTNKLSNRAEKNTIKQSPRAEDQISECTTSNEDTVAYLIVEKAETVRNPSLGPSRKKHKQSTNTVNKKLDFSQKKNLDDKLLKMITTDFQPFSIVEDAGFRAYSHALNPGYTLPSAKVLSQTLLPAKFTEVYEKSQEIIKDAISVTLTTECWTSCKNESFMALTVNFINSNFEVKDLLLEVTSFDKHHTSADLALEIKRITTEWGLEDCKILLAVSDDTENIKKAFKDELKWCFFGCLAHTINLIVQDALKTVEPLINKVKDIVSYFRTNTVAKYTLDFYQKVDGGEHEPKRLIHCMSTRWNSVFLMFSRILEIKEEVSTSFAALDKEDLSMLTEEEFERLREIVDILSPMEMVTRAMSGEEYVTLSSVIIINNCLQDTYSDLQKQPTFSAASQQIIKDILTGLNTRLNNLESNTTLLVSTFLDPRFKIFGFSSDSAVENAKTEVSDLLENVIARHTSNEHDDQVPRESSSINLGETYSIFRSFDEKVAAFTPAGTKKTHAITELQRYLEEPLLQRQGDPLNWWKANAYNYPNLSKVVRENFGTVATSVPYDRISSKTGELISARRNLLTSRKVKQIMFINRNS